MALNDTKVPSAASDVVAILDADLNQIFETARPIKATVNEPSKPMEHPVETGAITTDNIIFLPIEIELSMILTAAEFRSVYSQIVQTFRAAPFLIVQTRTSTYKNMIIIGPPHEEKTDMYDAIPLTLKMKEVQIVAPAAGVLPAASVKNPDDTSTQDVGTKDAGDDYTITSQRYGTNRQLAQYQDGFIPGETQAFPPPASGPNYVSDADIVPAGGLVTTVTTSSTISNDSALPIDTLSGQARPPMTGQQVNDIKMAVKNVTIPRLPE